MRATVPSGAPPHLGRPDQPAPRPARMGRSSRCRERDGFVRCRHRLTEGVMLMSTSTHHTVLTRRRLAAVTVPLAVAIGLRVTGLAHVAGRVRVDGLVELAVLGAGVLVLAWLALSCGVAAGCLTARVAGGGWRHGEAWVHRWAPVVVRRALVLAVGTGLGLSVASGASAADVPAPSPVTTVSTAAVDPAPVAAGISAGDLGWVPTGQGTASTPSAVPTSPPQASTPWRCGCPARWRSRQGHRPARPSRVRSAAGGLRRSAAGSP